MIPITLEVVKERATQASSSLPSIRSLCIEDRFRLWNCLAKMDGHAVGLEQLVEEEFLILGLGFVEAPWDCRNMF
jgi:hypothetical protein